MRICIDARSLYDVPTGLGRYAANIVSAIAAIDRENEYYVVRRPSRHGPLANQPNFREIFLPYDISSARNILTGAQVINALHADLYHALFHFLPRGVYARRVVITLHDLIWVKHAHLADGLCWRRWVKGSLGNLGIRMAMTSACHIIAISESTRKAAICCGVPSDKITTIHHGVAPVWGGDDDATDHLPDICRGCRFVFVLGNSLPYKNIPRLLCAFARVAEDNSDLFLALAGRGEGASYLMRLAHRVGLSDRVLMLGSLTDDQVRACFVHALFFAFPSLVEGFGLPVLEAMASGCPVLTSNRSSLSEIGSTYAVLVNPHDVASIAEGMQSLLTDTALRHRLSIQGQRWAASFTWKKSASQTIALYHQLFGEVFPCEPIARYSG